MINIINEIGKRKIGLNQYELKDFEDLLLKANIGQLQYFKDHLEVTIKDRLRRGAL